MHWFTWPHNDENVVNIMQWYPENLPVIAFAVKCGNNNKSFCKVRQKK